MGSVGAPRSSSGSFVRWLPGERSVWPVPVGVARVDSEHAFELATAEDQEQIEAFATESPDPTFSVRSKPWGLAPAS